MAGPTLVHGQQIYESMTSSIPLLNHGHFWGHLIYENIGLGLAMAWLVVCSLAIFHSLCLKIGHLKMMYFGGASHFQPHQKFMAEHFLVFSLTQAALEIAARAALGDEQDVNQS